MPNASPWKGFAAGVALTALAAAAFVSCRLESAQTPAPPVVPTTTPRRGPPDARPETRRVRGAKAHAEEAGEAAAAALDAPPPERSSGESADDDAFPGVDVEVVGFDQRPAPVATVYALPAGTDWKDGDPEPPRAETDAAGRARLRVLRRGRYDVGALSPPLHAVSIDVDVPGPAVRIVLPQLGEVVVVFDRPTPENPDHGKMGVGPDDDDPVEYPGRRQSSRWTHYVETPPNATRMTLAAPCGERVRVWSPPRLFGITPSLVFAPAEVRATTNTCVKAQLHFAFDPPTTSFPHPYVIRLEIAGDLAGVEPIRWWSPYEAGQAVGLPEEFRFEAFVPAAGGALYWKGEGVLPGSTTYAAPSKEEPNLITLPIRVAGDAPLPTPRESGETSGRAVRRTIRVKGGDDAGEDLVRYLVGANGTDSDETGNETLTDADARWALARRGEWIGGPAEVGADEEGVVELTLRRGGFLVVVPESRLPPTWLGELTIARKDGLPMLTDAGEECAVRLPLASGVVFGPLPEGAVAFVVRIGEEVVAEAGGVVRAGGYEPLRIPTIRGR